MIRTVTSISELWKIYDEHRASNDTYYYRGQTNNEDDIWEMRSTLSRKWDHKLNSFQLMEFTKRMIKDTKEYPSFSNLDPLEILSKMQHENGIPTPLIDFTSDFFTALWFSIFNGNEEYEDLNEKNEKDNPYFSLFVMKWNADPKLKLNIGKVWEEWEIYSCPNQIKRGLSQKSYFILENINSYEEFLEKYDIEEVLIKKTLQKEIFKLLDKKKVDSLSIYPDEKGIFEKVFHKSKVSRLYKAVIYRENNEFKKAINAFEDGLGLGYRWDSNIHLNLAVIYNNMYGFNSNYSEQAIENARLSIEEYPESKDNKFAYLEQANAFVNIGEEEKAINMIREAIKLDESYYDAHWRLGFMLLQKKDDKDASVNEAIDVLEKAVKISPENIEAYRWLGLAYSKNNNPEKAIKNFEEYLSRKDNWQIRIDISAQMIKLHKLDDAQNILNALNEELSKVEYKMLKKIMKKENDRSLEWEKNIVKSISQVKEQLKIIKEIRNSKK